ncbi:MAG TPA: JDVT-CTERM system glutamic-type intramembrane protease [Noviherbaspirillum sp.]
MRPALARELGLHYGWEFAGEWLFYAALAAAPLALLLLDRIVPSWSDGIRLHAFVLLSAVLWQPLVEELLFRGVIQGQLGKHAWGRAAILKLTAANFLASLLFALAHLATHAPAWAAAVILPSLVFGYFRDRYGHLLPSLLLHAGYNGCYLLIGADRATR